MDQVTFSVTVRTPGEAIDRERARLLLHDAADALAKQGGALMSVFAEEHYCAHVDEENFAAATRLLLTDKRRLGVALELLDNKQLGVVLGSALKQLDDRGDSSLSVLLRVLADRVEEVENEGGAA
jgi:hypothetical protein